MSEQRVNGTYRKVQVDRLGGLREDSDVDPDVIDDENTDAALTLESLRRRRQSPRPRADSRLRSFSRVMVGERERRLYLLLPDEIDYIESRGNYVEFHADGLVFISRDSLKRLSETLTKCGYIRIQRTVLLNVQSVLYAQRVGHGTYAFTLSSGARVRSGAKFRDEILRVLPLTRARRLRAT